MSTHSEIRARMGKAIHLYSFFICPWIILKLYKRFNSMSWWPNIYKCLHNTTNVPIKWSCLFKQRFCKTHICFIQKQYLSNMLIDTSIFLYEYIQTFNIVLKYLLFAYFNSSFWNCIFYKKTVRLAVNKHSHNKAFIVDLGQVNHLKITFYHFSVNLPLWVEFYEQFHCNSFWHMRTAMCVLLYIIMSSAVNFVPVSASIVEDNCLPHWRCFLWYLYNKTQLANIKLINA